MLPKMLLPLLVASALAVGFFVLALYRPNPARIIAGVGFLLAGLIDGVLALVDPAIFARTLAPHATSVYQMLLTGTPVRGLGHFILAVAIWQLLVGALILANRGDFTRLGCVAAALFLVGISPLGMGCAFPSNLILAGGVAALARPKWPIEPKVPAAKAGAKAG